MSSSASAVTALLRVASSAGLLALGLVLSGCAQMSDSMMSEAFADPAQYDLYDCKQLEAERKTIATRSADLQGLMAKADTGVAGPVVAELAYRNEYMALRGQSRFADEAWRKNRCRETPPGTPATPTGPVRPDIKPAPPSRSGKAIN